MMRGRQEVLQKGRVFNKAETLFPVPVSHLKRTLLRGGGEKQEPRDKSGGDTGRAT